VRGREDDGGRNPPAPVEQILWLQRTAGNQAVVARIPQILARDLKTAAPAAQKVKVTVKWDQSKPPQRYLEKVFDDHPADWTADVLVDGKKVGTGDGSLDVELVEGTKHTILVVPKATKPDDYFQAKSVKKWKAAAGSLSIKLPFNRENRRFAEQSWAKEGLDVAKVGDIVTTTMLGQRVRVNKLVEPTVTKTNDAFGKLDPKVQDEVKKSIWSMGGYNVRTTSKGGFSNHSTGCAVDINPQEETRQNWHMQKDNAEDKRLMSLFQKVVQLEPAWKGYDPWKERDPQKILDSSKKFNERFPAYLAELLDDALGEGWSGTAELAGLLAPFIPFAEIATIKDVLKSLVVGPGLVKAIDPKQLEKAAKAADKAKKSATAKALRAVAKDWSVLRAWVEGVVVYKDKKGHEQWAYASDYEKEHPGADPAVMRGMVSLHPKLVEVMQAGGWTWLVDYKHDDQKDFMHFEDRAAQAALKK
jgi:hypothetical protein